MIIEINNKNNDYIAMRKAIFNYRNWKVYESVEIVEASTETNTTGELEHDSNVDKPNISHIGDGVFTFELNGKSAKVKFNTAPITGKLIRYNLKLKNRETLIKGKGAELYFLSSEDFVSQLDSQGFKVNIPRRKDSKGVGVYIGVPKGLTGPVKYNTDATYLGSGGGGNVLSSAKNPIAFGFFEGQPDDNKIGSRGTQDPIRKIRIFIEPEAKVITIKEAFPFDSWELTQAAKIEIDDAIAKGMKSAVIKTGASKDGDIEKVLPIKGLRTAEMKRKDWDRKLVITRWTKVKEYLSSKGVTSITLDPLTKNIYGVFEKPTTMPEPTGINRSLEIKMK